jgi:hypothetical protein
VETSSNVGGVTRADGVARPEAPQRRGWGGALSLLVGLVGIAALAASAWVYASTQRDILRLSTEMAQLRLSLDLYMQQGGGAAAASTGGDMLLDLSNRLAILEENWRGGPASAAPVPASTPAALPATPATGEAGATGGDCLPPGTRFMVAAGDRRGLHFPHRWHGHRPGRQYCPAGHRLHDRCRAHGGRRHQRLCRDPGDVLRGGRPRGPRCRSGAEHQQAAMADARAGRPV